MQLAQLAAILIGVVAGTIIYGLALRGFARKHFSWFNVFIWAAWMTVFAVSFEYFKVDRLIASHIGMM